MKRVRLNGNNGNGREHLFQKGREKNGGRKPGTPNKFTMQLKHAILYSLELAGSRLSHGDANGAVEYLAWLARREPAVYGRLIEKMLPLQIGGRLDGSVDVNHKYETVEDLAAALKSRGLPPPSHMIDITPNRVEEEETV